MDADSKETDMNDIGARVRDLRNRIQKAGSRP